MAGRMRRLCPLAGAERTSRRPVGLSAFDPTRTCLFSRINWDGTLFAEHRGAYEAAETIAMVTLRDSFHKAIEQYHQAQKEFVRGNPLRFKALCSHADDVTIIGGWGGVREGMERAGRETVRLGIGAFCH